MALAGVIAMDTSFAVVTFSVADPLTAPEVAVTVTLPALMPVANPLTSITANAPFDDVQSTCELRSCVLLSEKTPVAVNCTLPLIPTTVVIGVTTMLVNVAGVTVKEAVADMEL